MPEEKASAAGKYYQCVGGLTVGMTVAQEGEILEGEAFGEGFAPLDDAAQRRKFGRVLYKEVDPDDDMLSAIHQESLRVRALSGMQHPDMPPVVTTPTVAEVGLHSLSRAELRAKAKDLGLKFPEDAERENMIGAIEKKQRTSEGTLDEETAEVVKVRRDRSKKAIIEANPGKTEVVDEEEPEEEEEEE